MARPEPKALLDTAAAMRADASNARRLVAQELQRRDTELGIAHDRAVQRQSAAEEAVKTADDTRKTEHRDAREFRATAEDYRKQADAAEQKGDTRAAEETREQVQRLEARAEAAEARAVQADRDYDDARIDLATRQREANALDQQMTDMNKASNVAERQLDALEDKARLLDEAGRKLGAASVTDNVVDRAQLELDAEKLLKNANGMTLDVTGIATFTGQPVNLPELAVQPIDTSVAAAETPPPSSLQDEFTQVASGDGDAPTGDAPAGPGEDGADAGGPVAVAPDAPDAPAGVADPLGVDALGTSLAADPTEPAAAPEPSFAAGPDAQPGSGDASPSFDTGTEAAPDPATDVVATAPASDETSGTSSGDGFGAFGDPAGDLAGDGSAATDDAGV